MAYSKANRVFETTTTTGTGSISLAGAITGFQTFVSGIGDGNTCHYEINNGTDWEIGIGTVTAGSPDVLSRDTVLESTNSDAKVNWGSGTKNVFVVLAAQTTAETNANNTFSGDNGFTGANDFSSGTMTLPAATIALFATANQGKAPTRQYLKTGTAATYTTPANCTKIRVRMIGGGGGGSAFATNAGANGGTTSFGSFTTVGGSGGQLTGAGGAGGTGGTGTASLRFNGANGQAGSTVEATGGFGGGSQFSGPTVGGAQNSAGLSAIANTGCGGQGAANGGFCKGGGGAGEYAEFEISSPSATYTYTIGAGGAGGAAGTAAGGDGGSGLIIVEEFYGS